MAPNRTILAICRSSPSPLASLSSDKCPCSSLVLRRAYPVWQSQKHCDKSRPNVSSKMPRGSEQSVNQVLVDHLNEIASTTTDHLRRTVKRAARNLQKHPTLVLTKQHALAVHGIGAWLATQLEVFILNNPHLFPSPTDAVLDVQNSLQQQDQNQTTVTNSTVRTDQGLQPDLSLDLAGQQSGRDRGSGGASSRDYTHAQSNFIGSSSTGAFSLRSTDAEPIRVQAPSAALVLPDEDVPSDRPSASTARARTRGRGTGRGSVGSRGQGRRSASQRSRLNSETAEGSETHQDNEDAPSNRTPSRRSSSQKKAYRPPYRSAPCAILLALRQSLEVNVTTMMKVELAEAAQPFCDTQILTSSNDEQHTWYDGWSCVNKTLIRKGFVAKFGNPAKFQLTMEGRVLADSLAVEYETVAARTVSKFLTQPTAAVGSQLTPNNALVPAAPDSRTRIVSSDLDVARQTGIPQVLNLHRVDASTEIGISQRLPIPNPRTSITSTGSSSSQLRDSIPRAPLVRAPPHRSPVVPLSSHEHPVAGTPNSDLAQDILSKRRPAPGTVTGAPASHLPPQSMIATSNEQTRRRVLPQQASLEPSVPASVPCSLEERFQSAVSGAVLPQTALVQQGQSIYSATRSVLQPNSSNAPSSKNRVPAKRFSKAQVERSARVVKRLRQYQEEDCLAALRGVFLAGDFPKTDDKLYDVLSNELWKRNREEQVVCNSAPEVIRVASVQHRMPPGLDTSQESDDAYPSNGVTDDSGLPTRPTTNCSVSTPVCDRRCVETIALDSSSVEPSPARPLHESSFPEVIEIDDDAEGDDEVEDLTQTSPCGLPRHTKKDSCSDDGREGGSPRNADQNSFPGVGKTANDVEPTAKRTVYESVGESCNFVDFGDAEVVESAEIENASHAEHNPLQDDLQRSMDVSIHQTSSGAFPIATLGVSHPDDGREGGRHRNADQCSFPSARKASIDAERTAERTTFESVREFCDFVDSGSVEEVVESAEVEDASHAQRNPLQFDLQRSVDMSVHETANGAPVVSAVERANSLAAGTADVAVEGRLKKNTVIVILDKMERFCNGRSGCEWRTMAELLEEAGAECDVRTLPCGDAMFVSRYEDGSEVVLDYVIERKTVEDYASSVRDGRVSKQAFMMRKSGIENRLFVIEGDMRENKRIYENPEMHKKLTELEISEGFYIKHTKDIMDTVWFYASFRRRLEAKFGRVPKATLQTGRASFDDWVENMKRICRSLTLEQLFMMQLCQTPGVGEGRARAVLKRGIRTPQLLHKAYKSIDQKGDRETFLAGCNDGIGTSASRAVCKLFTAMNYGTVMAATSSRSRSQGGRG